MIAAVTLWFAHVRGTASLCWRSVQPDSLSFCLFFALSNVFMSEFDEAFNEFSFRSSKIGPWWARGLRIGDRIDNFQAIAIGEFITLPGPVTYGLSAGYIIIIMYLLSSHPTVHKFLQQNGRVNFWWLGFFILLTYCSSRFFGIRSHQTTVFLGVGDWVLLWGALVTNREGLIIVCGINSRFWSWNDWILIYTIHKYYLNIPRILL